MGNSFSNNSIGRTGIDHDELRSKAKEYCTLRDESFRMSKECYNNDNHHAAKKYSEQGKMYTQKIKDLNAEAANKVFAEKNEHREMNEIDLHGLFVEEAKEKFIQRVKYCREHRIQVLRVIVGKGLHSENGIAKIKEAIVELTEQLHLNCELAPENGGVLIVDILAETAIRKAIRWSTTLFNFFSQMLKKK